MAKTREQIASAVEREFPALLREIYGDRLKSVTLYGSYLRESFRPGVSDVNVLVILDEPVPEALRVVGRRGRRLMKANGIAPLILSRKEFLGSADVFPMEYFDILANRKVAFGDDVAGELSINSSNLRHQVEYQLRGSLLSLRKLAVAAGRKRPFIKTALRKELMQWSGSLSAILRGLLRLQGVEKTSSDPESLVQEINRTLGLEPGAILELLKCRAGDCADAFPVLDGLLERLGRLVEIVDSWEEG